MDEDLLRKIFMPSFDEALVRMETERLKLAHYTSFETAVKIIQGRALWMRNARFMNDVGEIEHGLSAVDAFFANIANRKRLYATLTPFAAGLPGFVDAAWSNVRANLVTNIYIACFSEHWPKEDNFGRLSMWRAYCAKPDGVALVLNTAAFRLKSNALNAYSSPVFYGDAQAFEGKLHEVLNNMAGVTLGKLRRIKERLRNPFSHGGVENDGGSLFFHLPGIGAIPANFSDFADSPASHSSRSRSRASTSVARFSTQSTTCCPPGYWSCRTGS